MLVKHSIGSSLRDSSLVGVLDYKKIERLFI
jgi:hypothetical protein